MSKLLRSRDRILIGLATFGDLFDEVVGGGSRAYHARKLFFYTPPWYKKTALQASVHRLLKTGLISKDIKNGQAFWQLTNKGLTQLNRSFPLIKWQKKQWDGWWRIVMFDINETNRTIRNSLRLKLIELGFGQWQKSVYVSPHDVAEDMIDYLEAVKLTDQVSVFVARKLDKLEVKINKMWDLENLNKGYKQIIEEWEKIDKKKVDEFFARKIIDSYLSLIAKDPFLPKDMLPKPWYFQQAKEVFKRLSREMKSFTF